MRLTEVDLTVHNSKRTVERFIEGIYLDFFIRLLRSDKLCQARMPIDDRFAALCSVMDGRERLKRRECGRAWEREKNPGRARLKKVSG